MFYFFYLICLEFMLGVWVEEVLKEEISSLLYMVSVFFIFGYIRFFKEVSFQFLGKRRVFFFCVEVRSRVRLIRGNGRVACGWSTWVVVFRYYWIWQVKLLWKIINFLGSCLYIQVFRFLVRGIVWGFKRCCCVVWFQEVKFWVGLLRKGFGVGEVYI